MYRYCHTQLFFLIGFNVENGLKVKQLAKQPLPSKTLLEKTFVEHFSKKYYFSNFKFTAAKFLHDCSWHNLIAYNTIWGRYWQQ